MTENTKKTGTKKLGIYLADSTLETLQIIGGKHDDIDLKLSSCVNLCVQLCALVARNEKIPLTPGELLFCCDILNGGAQMTEFKDPESVAIHGAFYSMLFSLQDAAQHNYGGELEKWGVDGKNLITELELMRHEQCQLFALAFATRQFWAGESFGDFKRPGDCVDYSAWARQWIDLDRL